MGGGVIPCSGGQPASLGPVPPTVISTRTFMSRSRGPRNTWARRILIAFGIMSGRRRDREEGFTSKRSLPRIETITQARGVLLEMSGGKEITAEQDEWQASIRKHNDQEFSAAFPEQETGTISLFDASRILLEHGDHDLYLG